MDISQVQKNQPLLRRFLEFSRTNIEEDVCFLISLNKYNTSEVPFDFKLMVEGVKEPFDTPGQVMEMQELFRGHDSYQLNVYLDRPIFIGSSDVTAFLEVKLTALNNIEVKDYKDYW